MGNIYHCHIHVSLISTHQHKPYVAIVLNDFFHYLKGSTKDTQYVLDPFRILYSYFFAYFNIWTGLMCILFYFWTNIGHVYYLHCKIYCVCLIYCIFIDQKLDNEIILCVLYCLIICIYINKKLNKSLKLILNFYL